MHSPPVGSERLACTSLHHRVPGMEFAASYFAALEQNRMHERMRDKTSRLTPDVQVQQMRSSFSSACTIKALSAPRCASANKDCLARWNLSLTPTQAPTSFHETVGDDFPIFHVKSVHFSRCSLTVCGASLFNSSCALTFCMGAVSASICFCCCACSRFLLCDNRL